MSEIKEAIRINAEAEAEGEEAAPLDDERTYPYLSEALTVKG